MCQCVCVYFVLHMCVLLFVCVQSIVTYLCVCKFFFVYIVYHNNAFVSTGIQIPSLHMQYKTYHQIVQ